MILETGRALQYTTDEVDFLLKVQAGFDLQLQKCILYPKTLEITRDNKIETQIPQNR